MPPQKTLDSDTISIRLRHATLAALTRVMDRYGEGTTRNRAISLLIHAADPANEATPLRPPGRPRKAKT